MTTEDISQKVVVALDKLPLKEALDIAKTLSGKVWGFKVNDLLVERGVSVVTELKQFGNVFADPKLYDIPNTVANSVSRLSSAGADIITVHCSGGQKMLEEAKLASGNSEIIGVTVLTSFDEKSAKGVYEEKIDLLVQRFCSLAAAANIAGVVASPLEAKAIRKVSLFDNLKIITPGIRNASTGDDQKRTNSAKQALLAGSNLLVVGRPITGHKDPLKGLEDICSR